MAKYNDLDMEHWREYTDIFTDTLWLIEKRDNSGAHSGYYHGNFVPQIPNQLMRRYTKKGEWVLDPFMGSGTTLIEAQRLGRNAIGIELQGNVAEEAHTRILTESGNGCIEKVYVGDSRFINMTGVLQKSGTEKVQLIIYHPPYWDIIKFSEDKRDISNSTTLNNFLSEFGKVVDNTLPYLEKGRYCSVIIGDKYANSEVVPLGFYCMNLCMQRNLKLKAILVKNFENTKGKSNQKGIWRYRALANDFYIFKHEYIIIFKKVR